MAKKLGLALIAAGAIGAYVCGSQFNHACENARMIKSNFEYKQTTNSQKLIELEADPAMRRNEMYGGFSAAGTFSSVFAAGGGLYILAKKRIRFEG